MILTVTPSKAATWCMYCHAKSELGEHDIDVSPSQEALSVINMPAPAKTLITRFCNYLRIFVISFTNKNISKTQQRHAGQGQGSRWETVGIKMSIVRWKLKMSWICNIWMCLARGGCAAVQAVLYIYICAIDIGWDGAGEVWLMIIVIRVCLAQCGHLVRAVIRIKTVSLASPGSSTLALIEIQDSADQNWCWWVTVSWICFSWIFVFDISN